MNTNVITDYTNKWELIKCENDSDFDSAIDFLNDEYKKNDGIIWNKEYLKWKLIGNNSDKQGIIFLAKFQKKTIGILSLTLKYLHLNGKNVVIGELGDGYTSKKIYTQKPIRHYECQTQLRHYFLDSTYVKNSIAGRLCAEIIIWAKKNGIFAIYGTPNDLAIRSWVNRFNFEIINQIDKRVILTSCLFSKRYKLNPYILKTISWILDTLYISILKFQLFGITKYDIEQLKLDSCNIGNDFNDLWKSYIDNKKTQLVRNKDWIKWRYIYSSNSNYRIFTLRKSNILVGWCVLDIKKTNDLKKISICDWIYTVNDGVWSAFIYKILKQYDFNNVIVTYWILKKKRHSFFPFSYTYGKTNLIFKILNPDTNFNNKVRFQEFLLAHSDNI